MKTKTLVLTPGSRSTLSSSIGGGFTCIFKIAQQLFSLQFKISECYNTNTHTKKSGKWNYRFASNNWWIGHYWYRLVIVLPVLSKILEKLTAQTNKQMHHLLPY